MSRLSNDKKRELLGEAPSTAANRLRKAIIFDMLCRLGLNSCVRCDQEMQLDDYSIEHLEPWGAAIDPVKAFFDLNNIGFSHLHCNIVSGRKFYFGDAVHGTVSMYSNYDCRCVLCSAAHSDYMSSYHAKNLDSLGDACRLVPAAASKAVGCKSLGSSNLSISAWK